VGGGGIDEREMDDVLKLRGDDKKPPSSRGIFVSSDVDARSIDFPERVVRAPSNLGEVGARLPHLRPLLHRGSAREGPEVVQDVRREPRVPRVAVALEERRARVGETFVVGRKTEDGRQ
jgi:hypothetical protein